MCTISIIAIIIIAAVFVTCTSRMMILCSLICGENSDAGGAFGAGGSCIDCGFVFAGSVVAVVSVAAVGVTCTSDVMVLRGSTCGEDGHGGRCGGSCGAG